MLSKPAKHARTSLRNFDVTIPTADGSAVAERVTIKVPMLWDEEIGEWVLTATAEDEIDATKARYLGLLQPDELRDMRRRLNLSQQEIGDLLQIGAKSWTRWETGRQRQSRSVNLLLRAIHVGLISPAQLRGLGQPQPDWSDQFRRNAEPDSTPKATVIDLCRYRSEMQERAGYVEPLKVAL